MLKVYQLHGPGTSIVAKGTDEIFTLVSTNVLKNKLKMKRTVVSSGKALGACEEDKKHVEKNFRDVLLLLLYVWFHSKYMPRPRGSKNQIINHPPNHNAKGHRQNNTQNSPLLLT